MGIEHSTGSQTLCYINADHQEECFRNEFEMHNIFEMGFDILQKDAGGVLESLQYAKEHNADLSEDTAAALEKYMSEHHSSDMHDIEALQHHLTEAQILTEPHAPIHDFLQHAQLAREIKPTHHIDETVSYRTHDHYDEESPIHHYSHHDHHHEDSHHHDDHHHEDRQYVTEYPNAHEALQHDRARQAEELQEAIEHDFVDKLINYKQKKSGHEYRLFGHTMVSYQQLQVNVKHNQCVKLHADHLIHTERSDKWICQSHLDDFWNGDCLTMDPTIQMCDEKAIQVFLGKCVEVDGFKVCPSEPIVVEHLKTEEHTPENCYHNAHGELMCPSDLYSAFNHGSCFRADHTFICEQDMDHIESTMCADVGHYTICGHELYDLFHGEDVMMADGHHIEVSFPSDHRRDAHDAICREHEGIEFCMDNILDLYSPPHDCVMIAGDWLCQDTMLHAWRSGCIAIDSHRVCGMDMMDAVLQSCIEIDSEWICPTAVGTRHGHY